MPITVALAAAQGACEIIKQKWIKRRWKSGRNIHVIKEWQENRATDDCRITRHITSMQMIFEWQGTKLVARSYKDSTDVLQAKYVAGDVNTPWGTKPNTEEEKNMVMSLSVPEHVYGKWWWGL